jgi:hypothetical protein
LANVFSAAYRQCVQLQSAVTEQNCVTIRRITDPRQINAYFTRGMSVYGELKRTGIEVSGRDVTLVHHRKTLGRYLLSSLVHLTHSQLCSVEYEDNQLHTSMERSP